MNLITAVFWLTDKGLTEVTANVGRDKINDVKSGQKLMP